MNNISSKLNLRIHFVLSTQQYVDKDCDIMNSTRLTNNLSFVVELISFQKMRHVLKNFEKAH